MDEEAVSGPKLSTAEIIVVGFFFATIDIIDLVGLLFALPLSTFTSVIAFPASQLYARMRGIRQDMILISNGLELLPWIGDLPLRTIAFGITAYMENNPKAKALAGKVTGAAAPAPEEARGEEEAELEAEQAAEIQREEQVAEEVAEEEQAAEAEKEKEEEKKEEEIPETAFGMPEEIAAERQRALFEEPVVEARPKEEQGAREEAPQKRKEEEVKEEQEALPGAEIEGSRLGGAYAQEESILKGMEEVPAEGNLVNLRKENGTITDASSRFGDQAKKPDTSKGEERLAA